MQNINNDNILHLPDISTEDAVNLLLASIAFEEIGLAHLINAEAEKIQSVLGTLNGQQVKNPSISDLVMLDNVVERILKNVIKKEILLQFKLESVLEIPVDIVTTTTSSTTSTSTSTTSTSSTSSTSTSTSTTSTSSTSSTSTSTSTTSTSSTSSTSTTTSTTSTSSTSSTSTSTSTTSTSSSTTSGRPCRCSFTGSGTALVTNEQDTYFGNNVQIDEPMVCADCGSIDNSFLKYRILPGQTYVFTAFPKTLQILCPNPFNNNPTPEDPNVMIIMGRGRIESGSDEDEGQFTYIISDGGEGNQTDELQMIIAADTLSSLNHSSGIMQLNGDIQIGLCNNL